MPRKQVHNTPATASFLGVPLGRATGGEPGGRPIAVLFSTRRALPSERQPSKQVAAGGIQAAFADAFANRALRLGELAAWMRAQDAVRSERALAGRALEALETVVGRFLPGYANLRPDDSKPPRLLIDRGNDTVAVRQVSDGERGVLALVLDLTRRLVQGNPELDDPVAEAEGMVLIDELELHLHPKWQRQVVKKLTKTFPRCQFIATSHSPQIVASVNPGQVHLLTPTGVIRPRRSRGMDSNWILRHLMESDDRPGDARAILESVERAVAEGEFAHARDEIAKAKQNGFDLPEWSVLEARIARLEILAE
ncbi:MAG: AAA family ATPase [Gemmatimonadales bacterium]|nr:AAA family ATPase [Gemmatimonadales bacterium]